MLEYSFPLQLCQKGGIVIDINLQRSLALIATAIVWKWWTSPSLMEIQPIISNKHKWLQIPKFWSLIKARIIESSRRINTILTVMVLEPSLVLQRNGQYGLGSFPYRSFLNWGLFIVVYFSNPLKQTLAWNLLILYNLSIFFFLKTSTFDHCWVCDYLNNFIFSLKCPKR